MKAKIILFVVSTWMTACIDAADGIRTIIFEEPSIQVRNWVIPDDYIVPDWFESYRGTYFPEDYESSSEFAKNYDESILVGITDAKLDEFYLKAKAGETDRVPEGAPTCIFATIYFEENGVRYALGCMAVGSNISKISEGNLEKKLSEGERGSSTTLTFAEMKWVDGMWKVCQSTSHENFGKLMSLFPGKIPELMEYPGNKIELKSGKKSSK